MSMKKGINALELVFSMFILIVVTLVVIRLFTGIVKPDTLPSIDDFKYSNNYYKEKERCSSLCTLFTQSGCTDLSSATSFCELKVSVDIDGNYNPGEKRHYGIVNKIPYCEDGIYCFHIYDCTCGGYKLDEKNCLEWYMKPFYTEVKGLSDETTKGAICTAINYGTCEVDPREWTRKLPGYQYIEAKGADAQYGTTEGGATSVVGADFWYNKAGYRDYCGGITAGGLQLSCAKSGADIKCSWAGCSGATSVDVLYSGQATGACYSGTKPSGECTISNPQSGKYNIVLNCDASITTTSITV
jgi:hypothetical protein